MKDTDMFVRHSHYHCCWCHGSLQSQGISNQGTDLVILDTMPSAPEGLTHWGRAKHLCVGKLKIIGSDNGLSPGRCQAIIWTKARILLIKPLGTNLSEILIKKLNIFIQENALEKIICEMPTILPRPQRVKILIFCLKLEEQAN